MIAWLDPLSAVPGAEIDLETGLVRALLEEHKNLSWSLFGSRLGAPVISLSDRESILGEWVPATRELRINRKFAFESPWIRVVEVLKHEMAHQFVHEVLCLHEPPHGPAFRAVCEARGIDPRAAGVPEAEQAGSPRILDKVSKLLALATSANQHEAELAMSKAQALMRDHNLKVVQAGLPRSYRFLQLGAPKARIYEPERWLGAILSEHFFVDAIWVGAFDPQRGVRGSVLEICGTEENLAIAEYVHAFLQETAERMWSAHKAERGITKNRDRRRFHIGVMRGFKEKLESQQKRAEETGLIWLKDGDLEAYMRARHPRTRSIRRAAASENEAYRAGRAAGRDIVLNKPVSGRGPARGRRLGPGAPD